MEEILLSALAWYFTIGAILAAWVAMKAYEELYPEEALMAVVLALVAYPCFVVWPMIRSIRDKWFRK